MCLCSLRQVGARAMTAGKNRRPDLLHLDEPGCCPRCGEPLHPQTDAVIAGGSWCKRGLWGLPVTGGHLFVCRCPRCQIELVSFPDGWPQGADMDPSQVQWYPVENTEENAPPDRSRE